MRLLKDWRSDDWEKIRAGCAGTAKREMGIEFSDFKVIFEAGANIAHKETLKAVAGYLETEREESRRTMKMAIHTETRYRARGRVAFINEMLKYLRGEMPEEVK